MGSGYFAEADDRLNFQRCEDQKSVLGIEPSEHLAGTAGHPFGRTSAAGPAWLAQQSSKSQSEHSVTESVPLLKWTEFRETDLTITFAFPFYSPVKLLPCIQ
jgi:hypothetical protein